MLNSQKDNFKWLFINVFNLLKTLYMHALRHVHIGLYVIPLIKLRNSRYFDAPHFIPINRETMYLNGS